MALPASLALVLLSLAQSISISTRFEGGRLGKIEQVTATHFRCAVAGESDQEGRNRQANWYYFRVDGAAGRELTLDLVNLPGEYNFRPNRGAVTADTVPVFSEDNRNWTHFAATEYDAAEPRLRLRITPKGNRVWIAHVPPYTNEHLRRLRESVSRHPHFRSEKIGKSLGGRELALWTITDPSVPDAGKKCAWLMFRQHSWETGSSWVGEGAVRHLLSDHDGARRLRRETVFKVLPLCDPDGVARGGVRFNARGFDLNRNWDVRDPVRMPEIHAQRGAIEQWVARGRRVDLFLSLHNTETGEYLEGPTGAIADAFNNALRKTDFAPGEKPQVIAATPAPAPGRATVAQYLSQTKGLPAFLMEQRISRHAGTGRLPGIAERLRFGEQLVRAIREALNASPG